MDTLPVLKAKPFPIYVCFLHQLYADTIDFLIEMHDKLMTGVYSRAENNIAEEMKRRRQAIDRSLTTFRMVGTVILDDSIDDSHGYCQPIRSKNWIRKQKNASTPSKAGWPTT